LESAGLYIDRVGWCSGESSRLNGNWPDKSTPWGDIEGDRSEKYSLENEFGVDTDRGMVVPLIDKRSESTASKLGAII